jgi:hypothetical protein
MTLDPVLTFFVGALGASVVGMIGALIGAATQSRREHRRWVRQERLVVYRRFLDLAERDPEPETSDYAAYMAKLGSALAAVELLGPDGVAEKAAAHFHAAIDYSRAADRYFDEAMKDAPDETVMKDAKLVYDRETEHQKATRRAFTLAARRQLQMRRS